MLIHSARKPYRQKNASAFRPRPYVSESRGAVRQEQVILGAAFTCGLNREVIEFFPYGSQVEYELIRSIDTVSQPARVTIGVAETDAFPAGGFLRIDGQSGNIPPFKIIEELQKQYDVQPVSLVEPLQVWNETEDDFSMENLSKGINSGGPKLQYDVMLVIQPSKMSPTELDNLLKAIEAGQPTVIFEDPAAMQPSMRQRVPPTAQPRLARMPRGGSSESPKINKLWRLLGISVSGDQAGEQFAPNLLWQKYNPYRRGR